MISNQVIYEEKLNALRNRIKKTMKEKNLTQHELVRLCKQKGVQTSQSAISSVLTGNKSVALNMFLVICDVLEINVFEEMEHESETAQKNSNNSNNSIGQMLDMLLKSGDKTFRIDPRDIFFNGVIGEYYCYFHSTKKNEDKLIEGKIVFEAKEGFCKAIMTLRDQNHSDMYFDKHYEGFLLMSPVQNAAYCLLINPDIGEVCYITFWHKPILNRGAELQCRMASAATVSAGVDTRLSTIHRLFFSRKPLTEAKKLLIRGQLRLNTSKILLSKQEFEQVLEAEELTTEFREYLKSVSKEESYYVIKESAILSDVDSAEKYFRDLCILREYSEAPTDNKVRINTDGDIFYHVIREKKDSK